MDKERINFLQINASDLKWGASLEAYRLHRAFLAHGHGSRILCAIKISSDPETSAIIPLPYGYIPNALIGKFFNTAGLQSFGYPSSFFIKHSRLIRDFADIIVLRNLHWWYFSIGILPWLAQKKPLIWRFPDMWALTGHCAYSYDCEKWNDGCGSCPRLLEYPELFFDTTHFLWLRKKKIYDKIRDRMVLVVPSLWLKKLAERSVLTRDFRCEVIPTAVDTEVFKPHMRRQAREKLGIAAEEKVAMFSSFKLNDKRKGPDTLVELLEIYKKNTNTPLTLLLLGQGRLNAKFPAGIRILSTGLIGQDNELAQFYSACDVFLSLSKADNLPNTIIEASACGVPVIALNSGGCREAIEEGGTGYIVPNAEQAAKALIKIFGNNVLQQELSNNGRVFAEKRFSMRQQVESFVKLAQGLVGLH